MATAVTGQETVEVTVRAIASGGAGVADLPDGRVVFVPRTAPGDRARIRLRKSKPRWALGTVDSYLERASCRVEPLCALYDECGGCQLQHLAYDDQLDWKRRFVHDALSRIGHLDSVDVPPARRSPLTSAYRSRVTFTLRRLRGGYVVAGFHALERPAHVVDVSDECVLPEPAIMRAWTGLRSSWGEGARLLPSGGRLRLTLRAAEGGVSLMVEGGPSEWEAGPLALANPALVGIWHQPAEARSEARLLSGPGRGDPAPAFEQVNAAAAILLRESVLDAVGTADSVVDGYCGSGYYARPLAERGSRVTGLELDPGACTAARRDAPDTLRIVEGRVEDHLADVLPADVLIVNPPRTGLHEDIPAVILAAPPSTLVYVSCDPATLARDLKALGDGFALTDLHVFDLFPQTAHVETVAVLARQAAA